MYTSPHDDMPDTTLHFPIGNSIRFHQLQTPGVDMERTLQPARGREDIERDGEPAEEEAERLDDEEAVPSDCACPTAGRACELAGGRRAFASCTRRVVSTAGGATMVLNRAHRLQRMGRRTAEARRISGKT
jgi:hypothetical protein